MRYRFLQVIVVLVLCFGVFSLAQESLGDPVKKTVDNVIEPYLKKKDIPGAAVALYYRGKTYFFNYGVSDRETKQPVTQNTIFEIASVTKVFTATLLAVEVEQKKIGLKDSIANYLPALQGTTNLPIDQVTPQDLATHTAGFPRDINGFGIDKGDLEGLLIRLRMWQPEYPIGTRFVYSNISFGLLGSIVANVSKQSYVDTLQQMILSPLHMADTFVTLPPDKQAQRARGYNQYSNAAVPDFVPTAILGGGELLSTSADLMQFMLANLNQLSDPATAQLTKAMQMAQQPYFKVKPDFTMGLGWQRVLHKGELFITKDGANRGFNAYVSFSPSKQIGVIILFNKNGTRIKRVANRIVDALLNQ